jgi:CubicO group peptidase (beta-lactamase class C family)
MDGRFGAVEHGALVEDHGAATVVPWWSFTKTVMATAALALVRDGRLTLDVPLPGRAFTLHQLLQHRAGVASYGGLAEYHAAVARDEDPWPVATLLARAEADKPRYPPGEGWEYSNIGYLFVRELIEQTCGQNIDAALRTLVLMPLGIAGPHVALTRADLADVAMGGRSYHPGWAYHGMMVGRLADAALLLDRLLTGDLLSAELHAEMRRGHALGGPVEGRPWAAPHYGLGLMCGTARDGRTVIGHTGGGPGSSIAVYRVPATPPFTAAAFALSDDPGPVETAAFAGKHA